MIPQQQIATEIGRRPLVEQRLSTKVSDQPPHVLEMYRKHREFLLTWKGKLIKATNHTNLIPIRNVFKDSENGEIVIQYEKFDGIKFSEYLQENTLSKEQLVEIIRQLFAGLKYLHSHGFIHRDIRMDNIWISNNGTLTVKIGDFEIARLLSSPESKNILGSQLYAPPEQASSDNVEGYYTDAYALGVVLCYLLSNTIPTFNDLFYIDDFQEKINRNYNSGLYEILTTATSSTPSLRYQELTWFESALIGALTGVYAEA